MSAHGRTVAAMLALGCACRSSEPEQGSAATTGTASADPWAEQAPRALPPPKVTHPFERPFLWSAKRDGKTTYLFGTLHGGLDAERRIPLWVWKYFDEATTLVEEANLQDIELFRWTLRPDGTTLRQELGEEYWKKLEDTVTPLVAGLIDTQSVAVASLRVSGYGGGARDSAGPMDGELLVRAQGLHKRIVFLETAAAQNELFTKLHDVESLRRLIDRRAELAPLNHAFMDAYVEGDAERLSVTARRQFRLGVADDRGLAALIEILLIARNRAWIPRLEEVHASGRAFVAVGALHLVGDDSVLDMLAARGFTIARVAPEGP